MARGKIVCFYGGKGGVGKTTTLLSLAGRLSKLNKKVLTAARITRKNAWLVQFIDDENKQNIVLQYDLNKF